MIISAGTFAWTHYSHDRNWSVSKTGQHPYIGVRLSDEIEVISTFVETYVVILCDWLWISF